MEVLIDKIAKVIFFGKFSNRETALIKQILENKDGDSREKANAICDLLGLERRNNRAAIEGEIYKHINTENP